jgi:hypothetical protein
MVYHGIDADPGAWGLAHKGTITTSSEFGSALRGACSQSNHLGKLRTVLFFHRNLVAEWGIVKQWSSYRKEA